MGPPFTLLLSELDNSQVSVAGGKAASLGELIRAGAPVPPGFVVTSAAFDAFMSIGGHRKHFLEVLQRLNAGQIQPAAAAADINSLVREVETPPEIVAAINDAVSQLKMDRVAVRSSATCEDGGARAWAGQLQTYLGIPPEQIVHRVRDCWLSGFTETALSYGAELGFNACLLSVAVVVQQIVASDVSGIAFSVHPVTQEPDIMLIEACYGMGEAIASGLIVPDQYIVERGSNNIVETLVGAQSKALFLAPGAAKTEWRQLGDEGTTRKLSKEQVVDYAKLLTHIHDHYGHPVDTEWAIQDGRLYVLQARPITTLAEEYEESLIGNPGNWFTMVRRPFSLVESTILARWTDAEHAYKSLGFFLQTALAIQDDGGMVNFFLPKHELEECMQKIVEMQQNDRPRLLEILRHGQKVYRDSRSTVEKGTQAFRDFQDAVEFFCHAAQHTTAFPAWTLIALEHARIEDPEAVALAEELRAQTLYPFIERRIIDPFVEQAARDVGFSAPEEAPNLVTLQELQEGKLDVDVLQSRLEASRQGRRFVYKFSNNKDDVRFVSQTGYLLMRLARQRKISHARNPNELSGQPAWPGVYRGRARLILTPDALGQTIDDGEVLVSIQSSPALMPLLRRCGAIVTDDGGVACHAAILSRELRKPTLIGTRSATSFIHNGDTVEVDTYAQVVRIIERAS